MEDNMYYVLLKSAQFLKILFTWYFDGVLTSSEKTNYRCHGNHRRRVDDPCISSGCKVSGHGHSNRITGTTVSQTLPTACFYPKVST